MDPVWVWYFFDVGFAVSEELGLLFTHRVDVRQIAVYEIIQ